MEEQAAFAAGCFWGVEAAFRQVNGVTDTEVGYMGGHAPNPTYEMVCTGATGHAETVRIKYNPDIVSYEQLLDVFWNIHDPTQVNRQGPNVGNQYRSVIFYYTEEQRTAALKSKAKLDAVGKHNSPIATEIAPAAEFWRAEEYHQRYLEKKGVKSCRSEQ